MKQSLLITIFLFLVVIAWITSNYILGLKKKKRLFLQKWQEAQRDRAAIIEEIQMALVARDEFLSIASHELKTPLTSLILHSQHFKRCIERGDPDLYSKERIDVMINRIEKQVFKLNRLVDDMLDISRIRTGKMSLHLQEFNFSELIHELEENLLDLFSSSNTPRPIIQNGCGNIMIKWDRTRIEQVLTHLFTNAITYGEGKPIILTTAMADEKVMIHLKDHGIGIAEENLEKIFNCFEKTRPTSEVAGLGLGLFISQQIINAHQGNLSVKSQEGLGSIFTIELPLSPQQ